MEGLPKLSSRSDECLKLAPTRKNAEIKSCSKKKTFGKGRQVQRVRAAICVLEVKKLIFALRRARFRFQGFSDFDSPSHDVANLDELTLRIKSRGAPSLLFFRLYRKSCPFISRSELSKANRSYVCSRLYLRVPPPSSFCKTWLSDIRASDGGDDDANHAYYDNDEDGGC